MLKRRPYDSLNVEFNDYNPYRTSGEFKPREDSGLIVEDRARPDEIELVLQNPVSAAVTGGSGGNEGSESSITVLQPAVLDDEENDHEHELGFDNLSPEEQKLLVLRYLITTERFLGWSQHYNGAKELFKEGIFPGKHTREEWNIKIEQDWFDVEEYVIQNLTRAEFDALVEWGFMEKLTPPQGTNFTLAVFRAHDGKQYIFGQNLLDKDIIFFRGWASADKEVDWEFANRGIHEANREWRPRSRLPRST